MPLRSLLLALCLVGLVAPVRGDGAAAPSGLPPPWASGAGAGLLGPAPAPGISGGHLRGLLAFSGAGAGAPLLFDYRLSASGTVLGWAEAGVTFSGRWLSIGQHQAGPVELWLRAGPRWGPTALQGVVEVASGRGGFDLGGALYPSVTTLGALVASERGRFSGWLSATYQSAGEDLAAARYRGLQLGAALWLTALRDDARYHLQLGGEGLLRLGWREDRGADVAAIFALTARLVDEHGAAFSAGGGKGWGEGVAPSFGAVRIGWSFGPSYRHERTARPLLDELSDWLAQQWAHRTPPGFGAPLLPPPSLLPREPAPGLPGARTPRPSQPPHCDYGPRLPARGLSELALRSCHLAWDLGRGPSAPPAPFGPAAPPAGSAGPSGSPPAPQAPLGPALPQGLAQAPPRPPRPSGAMPRGGLRTGRGVGWTDPDTRAPAPADLPPTAWTGGRPGGPSIGPADAPAPPPSIPIGPQAPGPLPPGLRPEAVPPYLRPPAAPRGAPAASAEPPTARAAAPAPAPPRAAAIESAESRGGTGPVRQGQRAVEAYKAEQEARGVRFPGQEVSIRTSRGLRRPDLIEQDPRTGKLVAVEVKSGGSRYRRTQRQDDAEIRSVGGTAVGEQAKRAGVAGSIQIETKVVRVPRPKDP